MLSNRQLRLLVSTQHASGCHLQDALHDEKADQVAVNFFGDGTANNGIQPSPSLHDCSSTDHILLAHIMPATACAFTACHVAVGNCTEESTQNHAWVPCLHLLVPNGADVLGGTAHMLSAENSTAASAIRPSNPSSSEHALGYADVYQVLLARS